MLEAFNAFVPVIFCTLMNDRDKMTWQIFTCLFVLTATVVSNESSTVPHFVARNASDNSLVLIDAIFPDGFRDTLVLKQHYNHESDRNKMDRRLHCNYFGHLESDKSACIAMTGCLGVDDIDLTMTSDHLKGVHAFTWKRDGAVEAILDMDEGLERGNLQMPEPDNDIPRSRGGNLDLPRTMLLKVKVGYDNNFKEAVNSLGSTVDEMIASLYTHTQVYYCRASLTTKIKLQRVGELTHYDHYWVSSYDDTDTCAALTVSQIQSGDIDANLYNYMVCDPERLSPDIGGLAWKKAICNKGRIARGLNTNTIEFYTTHPVIRTAQTMAHEFGHNFGMYHDHDEKHEGFCDTYETSGLMSYGTKKMDWSECSVSDLKDHYNNMVAEYGSWCLEEAPDACEGVPSGPQYGILVMAGGRPGSSRIEVRDLDGDISCEYFTERFPTKYFKFSSYAYLPGENAIMACGGVAKYGQTDGKCVLLHADNTWTMVDAPPNADKTNGDGVEYQNHLVIVGGESNVDQTKMTIVSPSGEATTGPEIGYGVTNACIVKLDDTNYMMIGGIMTSTGNPTSSARVYDTEADQWIDKASLDEGLAYHDCTVIKDDDGNPDLVVLAGGYVNTDDGLGMRKDLDVYDVKNDEWWKGPDMPAWVLYPRLVTAINDKTVFLTGGTKDIYRLTCDSVNRQCQWTLHDVKAKRERSGHIAAIVPREFCVPK